jgi:hypothetical protein
MTEQEEAKLIQKIVRNEWSQIGIVVITMAGLFLWNRTESRADYRHLETSVNSIIEAIRQDMKDFHGRLCAIEERARK